MLFYWFSAVGKRKQKCEVIFCFSWLKNCVWTECQPQKKTKINKNHTTFTRAGIYVYASDASDASKFVIYNFIIFHLTKSNAGDALQNDTFCKQKYKINKFYFPKHIVRTSYGLFLFFLFFFFLFKVFRRSTEIKYILLLSLLCRPKRARRRRQRKTYKKKRTTSSKGDASP